MERMFAMSSRRPFKSQAGLLPPAGLLAPAFTRVLFSLERPPFATELFSLARPGLLTLLFVRSLRAVVVCLRSAPARVVVTGLVLEAVAATPPLPAPAVP